MLIAVIISAGCVITSAGAWGLVCNNRTFNQRGLIADKAVFGHPDWRARVTDYESVTYGAHLKALLMFRSPWALYPRRIREALGK